MLRRSVYILSFLLSKQLGKINSESQCKQRVLSIARKNTPQRKTNHSLNLFHNVSADQFLHDLVGTTVNAGHTAVRECTGHVVFPHETVATVHLHALVGHLN